MPHGLKDSEIQKLQDLFAANEHVEQVILYGSRAKGTHKPFSDVDITLVGENLTDADLKKLSLAIDDLLLPYIFDISLFSTLKNDDLIDHIRRNGVALYQKKIEWKEYKLGDVAEIVGGGTPSTTNKDYWDGDIPWLSPRDLTGYNRVYIEKGARNITREGLKNSSTRLLPTGTVLFSSRAPIGYVAIAQNEICTNQGFKSLVCNPDKLWNVFAYYWLRANTEYLQSLGTGTTFAEISGSVMKSIAVSLPLLSEQKRIASILSSLDDKIDLLHRENATLEAMAETLFRHHFIENPNPNWKEVSLTQVATFTNGLACQKYPPKNEVEKLPVLKIRELSNGIGNDSDWATTDVGSEYVVHAGDVIFAWSASLMVKIWDGEDCILNQHLFKVTSEKYPKWFYYFWCKHHLNEFISIAQSHATTMGHIKRKDLDSAMTLIASSFELRKIDLQIQPIYEKIFANNFQIRTLKNKRDCILIHLMYRG